MSNRKSWRALAWDDRPADFLDGLKNKLEKSRVSVEVTSQLEDFNELFHESGPWDFVILDVVDNASEPEEPVNAGIRLAEIVRRANPSIPIIFLTEAEDIILRGDIRTSKPILIKPKSSSRALLAFDIVDFVKENLYDYSKVFIIYGHGKKASGFKDKVIHSLKKHGVETVLISPENVMTSISDGLVDAMRSCAAFVAICTPDDKVGEDWYQPRQNVLLEIGMAMALSNGFQRLVILQRSGSEADTQAKLPSDLGGAFTIQFYDEQEDAIRRMLDALEIREIRIQYPS